MGVPPFSLCMDGARPDCVACGQATPMPAPSCPRALPFVPVPVPAAPAIPVQPRTPAQHARSCAHTQLLFPPLETPCFPVPLPFRGSTQVLALMPNPDCSSSSSSLAVSRCDTTELVKQAWQSACLCRPWCQAGLSPLPSSLLTHLVHLLALLMPGGSWCLPGQISASHKVYVFLHHDKGLQSHALMPLSANFRALGAAGTLHSSLHANYAHLTPEERRKGEGMSLDAFTGFLLQRLCPQELQHVSADRYTGFAGRW